MKSNIDRLEMDEIEWEEDLNCSEEADVQDMLSRIKDKLVNVRDFDEYVMLFDDE